MSVFHHPYFLSSIQDRQLVLVHNYGSYVVRKNARLILAATFSRYSIEVDIAAVQQEIDQLEKELETVQAEMDKYLKELLD